MVRFYVVGVAALLNDLSTTLKLFTTGDDPGSIKNCSDVCGLYHTQESSNGAGAQASASITYDFVVHSACYSQGLYKYHRCWNAELLPLMNAPPWAHSLSPEKLPYCSLDFTNSSPNLFTALSPPKDEQNSEEMVSSAVTEETDSHMGMAVTGIVLLSVTVVIAFCAEYLIASIEETAVRYSISKAFIGNTAEHVTSAWIATKNRYELIITHFALGIRFVDQALTLHFHDFETIVFFISEFLVNILLMDGKGSLMLITLYLVIAVAFWVA
ncbi:hypothetical protein DFJ58DRAFT_872123 [Suillus subalutaceus]|uniref:uncharacterized protein n=1 Tax=Suillus subalutaceus TaxID=48586 RepID=UPI001B880B2F|nr:uncharacterized protein DFJ58DRAFT_872123 [Suillus subalutaceus]KAG1831417.1 hypothetical protein DFJ58DRAFT_872123 [Suillus subalutaceus]